MWVIEVGMFELEVVLLDGVVYWKVEFDVWGNVVG